MKKYNKPVITDEIIRLEDIIASSGSFGSSSKGDTPVDFFSAGDKKDN